MDRLEQRRQRHRNWRTQVVNRVKVLNSGVTVLQVTLLAILFVLEYLSGYRAGVAQHLYFKKIHYIALYYQGTPLLLHSVLLLSMTIFAAGRYFRCMPKPVFNCAKYAILLVAVILFYLSPSARSLNIYAHALLGLEVCLFLEFAVLISIAPMSERAA